MLGIPAMSLEAYMDALRMERSSCIGPDEQDELIPSDSDRLELLYEAADMRRKEKREEELLK